ncbi:DEAD/DEAH box helicase [Bythopirellula goksoeyrii]|uniref:DEAD-box ATP-dependent RNA helicase CshA n=1 Tax=Bythopirellula goksoeyrii TaxID=1400387 RepID=A0A5B9Q9H4_9BACT|nr:DEAD/DEAH box helicase [Bythopirellula goksoeyrii]QEG33596.1 DEAD-box ATP-dependent RNA helicase CshA [Bythopirellula goksoeyrii]
MPDLWLYHSCRIPQNEIRLILVTNPASSEETPDSGPAPTFAQLGLSDVMLASLVAASYHEPSPVQAGIIPRAIAGVDVLGQARTGTGKTAAFAIPILERLGTESCGPLPQALVLVPTRELAVQVRDEISKLAHGRKTRCQAVYGGKPIRQQIDRLGRGADIVVGTPGRVIDLLSRSALKLEKLEFVVLDEADRMLDIGFRPDIEKILRRCPQKRQTLLLSATVAPGIERLAKRYMVDPEIMDFSPKNKTVDTIEQHYFSVDEERKYELLVRLIQREDPEQAIVFCRTKRGTDRLHNKLSKKTPSVDLIHGDMQQSARDRVMRKFRAGDVKILIATDVVGRGIDVSNISHIVNYDLPQSSDDYVHRVGRTGRMGREGVAYSFVTPEQGIELTRIEMLINTLLKRDEIEGFQTVATAAPPQEARADAEPAEKKPAPPGQRPRRRHRRGL